MIPTIKDLSDIPKYAKIFTDVVMGRQIRDFQFNWVDSNGNIRYGLASIIKIRIDGNKKGLIALLKNCTSEIIAQKEIELGKMQFLSLSHIAEEILCHHEWWNGKAYPRGLKGKQIPSI